MILHLQGYHATAEAQGTPKAQGPVVAWDDSSDALNYRKLIVQNIIKRKYHTKYQSIEVQSTYSEKYMRKDFVTCSNDDRLISITIEVLSPATSLVSASKGLRDKIIIQPRRL